jgi:hypothetical protein
VLHNRSRDHRSRRHRLCLRHHGDGIRLLLRSLNVDEFGRRNVGFDFFELGRGRGRFVDIFWFVDLGDLHRRDDRLRQTLRETGIKCPTYDDVQKDDD